MIGFIYKVTNLINNKVYIGQTIQDVKYRWYRHCGKSGISQAELNTHFKRAILKYGKENFKVEVIEECDSSQLNEREKYYISYFDSYNNGYNSTLGGTDGYKPYKTNDEENQQIAQLYEAGFSLRAIAQEYKLDKTTVKGILTRLNINLRGVRNYKYTSEERSNMLKDLANGLTRNQVIDKYKVSKSYLSQLITGNRRI